MTRRELLRVLVAMGFLANGNAAAFMWMLPRGMKRRARSAVDLVTWRIFGEEFADNMFRQTPLMRLLRTNAPMDGGTFIQVPLLYNQ